MRSKPVVSHIRFRARDASGNSLGLFHTGQAARHVFGCASVECVTFYEEDTRVVWKDKDVADFLRNPHEDVLRKARERRKVVLRLREKEGWSLAEIGRYYGVSREAARQVYARALRERKNYEDRVVTVCMRITPLPDDYQIEDMGPILEEDNNDVS